MDLENALGIVISKDGVIHSFGKSKMAPVSELDDENFHDPAFKKDIVDSSWFQDLNIPYDNKKPLRRQIFDMTSYGLTFILNGNYPNGENDVFYLYTIQSSIDLSNETRECLENNYSYLASIIEKDQALFEGEAYLDGEYIWDEPVYKIDSFYDKLGLAKGDRKEKGRR